MISLQQAQQEFRKHLEEKGRATATIIAYVKDIDQLVTFASNLGKNRVQEVTVQDLESFMGKFSQEGYTNKSISRKTNSTKTFFRFLESLAYIQENPAKTITHPEVINKEPRILSKHEYMALRDVAREDARTYAAIEVLLQTGIRINELHRMQIEHIEFSEDSKKHGKLSIDAYESHSARTVPLNNKAQEAIKAYIETYRPESDSAHMFITSTGRPWLIRNIRSTLNRYFRKAELERVTVNDLRHTFIAHHLEQGTSVGKLSQIVGHKRVSTTEKYLNYVEKPEEETDSLKEL